MGFLEDYPCFEQCWCRPAYFVYPLVDCSNRGFVTIPTFDTRGDIVDQYVELTEESFYLREKILKLQNNEITEIPEQAFANLKTFYPESGNLTIDLSFNKIYRIDINALKGLENNTINLLLRGNMVTFIPEELVNKHKIDSLDITLNPIKILDIQFISFIAPTLLRFYVSVNEFSEMPKAMGFLQAYTIGIDGLHETELNATLQDDEYTNNLKELFISNSTLEDVNIISCRFPNLPHLHLEDNYNLNVVSFRNCSESDIMPLNKLEIENGNVSSVDISVYQMIEFLTIRNNHLENVPDSIVKLEKVLKIDLANNLITEINDGNFKGLTTLKYLILDNNPLRSIADSACMSTGIRDLSLRGTLITTIPLAFTRIPHLNWLTLPHDNVECTCSSLAPLSGLHITYSNAGCKDSKTKISDFIRDNLPLCSNEN